MTILIDNRSGQPIYEQIVDQIRDQILAGALKPDTALPSIRSLAKDLRISVITTKRAYEELEQAGFLYTVAGKGCFVAEKNPELCDGATGDGHMSALSFRRLEDAAAFCRVLNGRFRYSIPRRSRVEELTVEIHLIFH